MNNKNIRAGAFFLCIMVTSFARAGIGSVVTVPVGAVAIAGGLVLGIKSVEEFNKTKSITSKANSLLNEADKFMSGTNNRNGLERIAVDGQAFLNKYGKVIAYGTGSIICLAVGKKLVIG